MLKLFSFLIAILTVGTAYTQNNFDIATVMGYNILNYRNTFGDCSAANNPTGQKEDYLKKIIQHVEPDIVCFNEVGNSINNIASLQNNVMNADGVTKYDFTDYQNSSSSLINVTFYNNEVFETYREEAITTDLSNIDIVRLVDVITFYYKDPQLAITQDTTFLTVFVAHLKAGQSGSDANRRARATESIMDYIANHPEISSNFLLVGDLNIYNATEDAFQNLVTGPTEQRFFDPINQVGNWANSASYSYVHTQSTRLNQTNGGCFSGGGMDNRFDFILSSNAVLENTARVEYINNSYEALGQDGARFNQTINFPANNQEPDEIIEALYEASDHLPVLLDLKLSFSAPVSFRSIESEFEIKATNPIRNYLSLDFFNSTAQVYSMRIFTSTGQKVWEETLDIPEGKTSYVNDSQDLPKGLLLVQLTNEKGESTTLRIIKI